MITIGNAKELVEKETEKKALSCALYKDFYIFTFENSPFLYKAVSKHDGRIFNFTPSLDIIGYSEAKKVVF